MKYGTLLAALIVTSIPASRPSASKPTQYDFAVSVRIGAISELRNKLFFNPLLSTFGFIRRRATGFKAAVLAIVYGQGTASQPHACPARQVH